MVYGDCCDSNLVDNDDHVDLKKVFDYYYDDYIEMVFDFLNYQNKLENRLYQVLNLYSLL